MFIGKNKVTGVVTDIKDAILTPNQSYICPICGADLILKNGSVVVPHFAHKSGMDCDTFTSDMSEWHKNWQEVFPLQNREHVEELQITVGEYKNNAYIHSFERPAMKRLVQGYKDTDIITLKHRADVRACGYIIEFQNSPISREEFNERNWFYTKIGCKVVWVFNFTEEWSKKRIKVLSNRDANSTLCQWNYAKSTFKDFLPQRQKDVVVYFQFVENFRDYVDRYVHPRPIEDNILSRVSWSIQKGYCVIEETGEFAGWLSDFKKIVVKDYICSKDDFFKAILARKI